MADTPWAADTPISMPEPISGEETRVVMGGFVFTATGLRHDLTQADLDEIYVPSYAPPQGPS